jgi:hypothetical protein
MRRITLIAVISMAAFAQTPGGQPKSFASPDEAARALIDAASKDDSQALLVVLGPSAKNILSSGNASQDKEERQEFCKLATQKNRIEHSSMSAKTAILLVGNEDWPFPIPLMRTGEQWHFDPEAGAMEMRARKVGADELDAIEICKGYVGAQQAYAAQQMAGKGVVGYAQKITSSLRVPEGFATADFSSAGTHRKPYHGYYFRVLKEQAACAWRGSSICCGRGNDWRFWADCLARGVRDRRHPCVHGESGWLGLREGSGAAHGDSGRHDRQLRSGRFMDARGLSRFAFSAISDLLDQQGAFEHAHAAGEA